jgi:RNA polymerase sigma factor (sigma-70 family)
VTANAAPGSGQCRGVTGTTAEPGELTAARLASLYEEHASQLHRYLARRLGGVADDLVADTFLIAWEQRARYDPTRASIRAWLYGIAANLARRHVRTELRRLRATARHGRDRAQGDVDVDARAASCVDADARVRRLASALTSLRDEDREVLLLIAWAGLEPGEAAAALGIPVGTARSRLHRARTVLRGSDTRSAEDDDA